MISTFRGNKVTAILLCVLVITINLIFVVDQVGNADLSPGLMALVGKSHSLRGNREDGKVPVINYDSRSSYIWHLLHPLQHLPGDPRDSQFWQPDLSQHACELASICILENIPSFPRFLMYHPRFLIYPFDRVVCTKVRHAQRQHSGLRRQQ